MAHAQRWVLFSILGIGLASGATNVPAQHYAHSSVDACTTCKANVDFYGHYPTRWRPWPGETRKDIHFPQAIGAEEIRRSEGSPKPKLPSQKLEPLIPQRSSLLPGYPPADGGDDLGPVSPPPPSATDVLPQPSAEVPEPMVPATPFQTEPMPTPNPPAPLPSGNQAPVPNPAVNSESASQSMMLPVIVPPSGTASFAPRPGAVTGVPPVDQFSGDPIALTSPSSPPASPAATASWTAGGAPAAGGGAAIRLSLGDNGGNPTVSSSPLVIRNPMAQGVALSAGVSGPAPGIAPAETLGTDVPRREWMPEVKPGPSTTSSGPSPGPAAPAVAFQPERPALSETQPAGYVGLNIPETAAPAGFETGVGPASAPLLEGFCPVQLVENERWLKGSPRFAAEWKGRVYWLSDAAALKKFVANAERYTPVLSGLDPVMLMQGERKDGLTDYCVVYDGRLYMFSSAATLARFRQSPRQYAAFAVNANP